MARSCSTKEETNGEARQDNKIAREELGAWKVEINCKIIIYYSDEYATDITDFLKKTISQEIL